MARAYIAIGSNVGQRAGHIEMARRELSQLPATRFLALSAIHETAPVGGPPNQQPYLNAAAALETHLNPIELMQELLNIERHAGRQRRERWGPRTLDLDLLLYDDRVIDEPGLKVPHPRLHERTFVLEPLAEIAPTAVHPTLHQTIEQLRRKHAAEEQ